MDHVALNRIVADVLLARLKRVGHVTHSYEDTILIRDQYSWALEFYYFNICTTNGTGNFLKKKYLAKNLSIDLIIGNSHDPSMYNLYMYNVHCTYITEIR